MLMQTTLWLVALLALTSVFGFAQAPTATVQPNTVYTGADGKFETAPDTALIQFNINAQADNAKDAYAQAQKQAEQVRQIMRSNGIDPKSAEVGFYSIQPMYDWKNPKSKVVGYRVSTSVTLKLKDFTKIGPMTQQLADAAVSDSQSVSYTLENIDEAKSKAVEDAYRRAHANAEALARVAGRTLGDLSYASVDTFENVRPMPMPAPRVMAMKAEAAPAPTEQFSPQNVNVTAHVNALFNLK
jgi:uncharacterized protein YggE